MADESVNPIDAFADPETQSSDQSSTANPIDSFADPPSDSASSTLGYLGNATLRGAGNSVAGLTNLAQRGERFITGQPQPQPSEQWGNAISNNLPSPGQPPNNVMGRLAAGAAYGAGEVAPVAGAMAATGFGLPAAGLTEIAGGLGGLASQGAAELGFGQTAQDVAGLGASLLTPTGALARGANIAGRMAGKAEPLIAGQGAKEAFQQMGDLGVSPSMKTMITGSPTLGEKMAAGTGAVKGAVDKAYTQLQDFAIPKVADAYNPGAKNIIPFYTGNGADQLLSALQSHNTQVLEPTVNGLVSGLSPTGRGQILSDFVRQLGDLPPTQQAKILDNFEATRPDLYSKLFRDPNLAPANGLFDSYRKTLGRINVAGSLTSRGGDGENLSNMVLGLVGEHALGPGGLALGIAKPVARWANAQRVVSPGLTATYPYFETSSMIPRLGGVGGMSSGLDTNQPDVGLSSLPH